MSRLQRIALLALLALLAVLTVIPACADLHESRGRVTYLRVHDVGTRFGPPSDSIDVEVVVQLDSEPGKSFGFQLRNDANRPAREGMLALLRDAFNTNATVLIDYDITPGKKNGVIIRVALTKP